MKEHKLILEKMLLNAQGEYIQAEMAYRQFTRKVMLVTKPNQNNQAYQEAARKQRDEVKDKIGHIRDLIAEVEKGTFVLP